MVERRCGCTTCALRKNNLVLALVRSATRCSAPMNMVTSTTSLSVTSIEFSTALPTISTIALGAKRNLAGSHTMLAATILSGSIAK